MVRLFFALFAIAAAATAYGQQQSFSVGVYTGVVAPFTLDGGMDSNPIYADRYSVKSAPFGLSLGFDTENYGIVVTPGLVNLGQHYYVVNDVGGQDGTRRINLRYLQLPVAFKLHLVELAFFRVSATANAGAAYLMKFSDHISHSATKLPFAPELYPALEQEAYASQGYSPDYDGVTVPAVNRLPVAVKDDYNQIIFFGGLGLRSDWDVSDHWRVSFDFRVNATLFDPRQSAYRDRIAAYASVYDYPGTRRELFAQLSVGISRFLEFDKNDRARSMDGGSRKYFPQKKSTPRRRSPR